MSAAQLTPIQTSFNAGELSARMGGRVDTGIYQVALETCENFVPTVEGPIVKRPGFEYINDAADSAVWLSTFRFSITQEYLIEWGAGKLRFFTNGARIETAPGVPLEVAVPYSADEAPFVCCEQSYDRLYMDHPNHPPGVLERTGAESFAYLPYAFRNGPFADTNETATTVSASAATGSGITLTASTAIFDAGQIGSLFRIEAADFAAIEAWQVGINGILAGRQIRSDGKVYEAASAGITGTLAPTHTSGTEWDGMATGVDVNGKGPYGIQWTYLHDRFGIVRITAVASGTSATADVVRRLPDSVVSTPTARWAKALFSETAGWPGLVKAAFGRLIHFRGLDVVASVAGDYSNHAEFTSSGLLASDMAFRRTLALSNPPIWVAGDRKLILGTASGEHAVGPVNSGSAVAGDNIGADPQSFYGSEQVWPLQAGTSSFFIQRGGRKVREANYDFATDRYVAANITVWSRQMGQPGIVQLAFQKEPEELLFGVRGDGELFVHPHQPEQEVKGFARIRHSNGAGSILSAASIVGADGRSDELWALVLRDGRRTIERMASWRDDDAPIEESFFVDSGLTAIATGGQTHFSGAVHLRGRTCVVLAGGGLIRNVAVRDDGTFDLPVDSAPRSTYRMTIGLPFTATAVTLRPELKINGQTSQNKKQRLVRIALRLLATVGIQVGAPNGKLDELIDRPGNGQMDQPIPLFTGDSDKAVSANWDRGGQAMFVSADPLPAAIVAAMPKVELET